MEKESWIKQLYYGIVQGQKFLSHFVLLVIRLYWGGLLFITGLGKLLNIHHVAEFFASLELPAPLFFAYFIGIFELIGGISYFIGLFSRLFSIYFIIQFFVAYASAFPGTLNHIFQHPSLFTMADPFLYLYTSFIIFSFGPGFVSVDYWLEKKAYGKVI